MTSNEAAEVGTPVSRTGEAYTPTAKKGWQSEAAVQPAAVATSPAPVGSGRAEIGGEHEKAAETSSVPLIVESQKNDELRTAVELIDYQQLDEHGEPLKEQERVSYQNMLVRYGKWSNVRCQVLVYFVVTILGIVYQGHSDELRLITEVPSVKDGKHIHCCCNVSSVQEDLMLLREEASEFSLGLGHILEFLGRRMVLLSLMLTSIPVSILLIFVPSFSYAQQFCHFVLSLTSLITMLITISSLIEMLPYETRYLAVYNYIFASSITTTIAVFHFRKFTFDNLGIMCTVASVIGAVLVKFMMKDSICHLNIRNNVDIIETYLLKQEKRLLNEKPEGGRHFHQAVAKKIFEDLVYLDQDELSFSQFFKRLWRNFAMIEIVLAFFQAISCGLHEYEFNRFNNERFVNPLIHTNDRLIGFLLTGILMYMLRKSSIIRAHRNRALCILFAAQLLNSAARHAAVAHDPRNNCGSIHIVKSQFNGLSMVSSVLAVGLVYCTEATILLHFLETTPSILRATCVLLVYMPMKFSIDFGAALFTDHASKDLERIPVYAFHVVIIILTMLRTRSHLPFNLYLFDLMPHNERDRDDRPSNEKLRPMHEESAQPPTNLYTERTANVTNIDDRTQTIRKERRGKGSEKSRLSFRRAL